VETKKVIGYVIGYFVIVAILYPFVGGIGFLYALGMMAMGALQAFFIWIWTEGANPPQRPSDG
jgi:hypothetical protein